MSVMHNAMIARKSYQCLTSTCAGSSSISDIITNTISTSPSNRTTSTS